VLVIVFVELTLYCREFNEWLGTLAFKHKIVIGGNHDLHLYHIGKEEATNLLSNATYLEGNTLINLFDFNEITPSPFCFISAQL
jgi:hypothetical protein